MIAYLSGTIRHIASSWCLLLVQGVGYEVSVPFRSLSKMIPETPAELFIYTHVREDTLKLFGFETLLEREMFITILGVSGVGPKTALSILSAGSVEQITEAIAEANVAFFTAIKGLGKKNAQRIIIELKNKLGSVAELNLKEEEPQYSNDVIEALQSFGFLRRDIVKTLKTLDTSLPEPQLIKLALQQLGKS